MLEKFQFKNHKKIVHLDESLSFSTLDLFSKMLKEKITAKKHIAESITTAVTTNGFLKES